MLKCNNIMPAFVVHGFMGYLLYGYEGLFYGLLPDIIGFGPFFYRIFEDYSFDPRDSLIEKIHSDKTNLFHLRVLYRSLMFQSEDQPYKNQ